MSERFPIAFRWNGEVMTPRQKWQASRQFVVGSEYFLIEHEERSDPSHRHFFATVKEAWKTLPESQSRRWADATHMRKWFLIKTGWSTDRIICAETEQGAKEIAALVGQLDPSAVVIIQGMVVTVSVARTQKSGRGGMNKEEFQKSKQAVLEEIAAVLGVDVATLSSQVSNSSDAPANRDRTDTPAADPGPQPPAAGVQYSGDESVLPPDWFDRYVMILTHAQNSAQAVAHRDEVAQRNIGGDPNQWERDLQRRVATFVTKRDRGKIDAGEFQTAIAAIRSEWDEATKGASNPGSEDVSPTFQTGMTDETARH